MNITDLKIGDRVQEIDTRFPMTVVGLHSTLEDRQGYRQPRLRGQRGRLVGMRSRRVRESLNGA